MFFKHSRFYFILKLFSTSNKCLASFYYCCLMLKRKKSFLRYLVLCLIFGYFFFLLLAKIVWQAAVVWIYFLLVILFHFSVVFFFLNFGGCFLFFGILLYIWNFSFTVFLLIHNIVNFVVRRLFFKNFVVVLVSFGGAFSCHVCFWNELPFYAWFCYRH